MGKSASGLRQIQPDQWVLALQSGRPAISFVSSCSSALSGGQRRRLALRSCYRKQPIWKMSG